MADQGRFAQGRLDKAVCVEALMNNVVNNPAMDNRPGARYEAVNAVIQHFKVDEEGNPIASTAKAPDPKIAERAQAWREKLRALDPKRYNTQKEKNAKVIATREAKAKAKAEAETEE